MNRKAPRARRALNSSSLGRQDYLIATRAFLKKRIHGE